MSLEGSGEAASEGESPDDDWTPERRHTLAAVLSHLLPSPGPPPGAGETSVTAVAETVRRDLAEPELAAREPWLLALLDELDDRAQGVGGPMASHDAKTREELLREVEAGDNAYLSQALRWLLQMALEAYLGDPERGGNPGGESWRALGLGPDGPRRRLGDAGARDAHGSAPEPR